MKLPLWWGLGLLAGLWVLHAFLIDPAQKMALLIVAMAVALWTAFSLNIPERKDEPERSLLEPPEEEGEGDGSENDQPTDDERNGEGHRDGRRS